MSLDADPSRAWLAICAAAGLTVLAMLVLGAPLGELVSPEPFDVLPDPLLADSLIAPEPTELARFTLLVLGALGLAAWLAYGPRELPVGLARVGRRLAVVGPFACAALLLVAWFSRSEPALGVDRPDYFSTLAGIAAVAAAAIAIRLAVRTAPAPATAIGRVLALLRRPAVAAAIAIGATACFLLPGVFTDASLPDALAFINIGHLPALLADYAAVGNGATPGVDFAPQYVTLLPYLLAPILALTDYSPGAYTVLMTLLSAAALLALWRALALLTRSELAGLVLYIPVLALSLVPLSTIGDERLANNSQYQLLPERYLAPCLLAWLVARHLRGLGLRSQTAIFALAGLGALNNPEFGIAAGLATFAALALATPDGPLGARDLARLAARAAIGAGAALVAVAALDVVRSGSLPEPSLLSYYSRLFGSQGFGLIAMPEVGLHWALYITFAGALALAALRSRSPSADLVMTGLLVYAGVFGLFAGGYYAGRSNSYSLIGLFPAWGFAVAILAWTAWLRAREAADARAAVRGVGPLGLAALVGLALAASTVTSVAAPWSQIARIADRSDEPSPFDLDPVERFVGDSTSPGEPIAFIGQNGHLISRHVGVRNVSPIGDPFHIVATEQLDDVLEALADQGGVTVFTLDSENPAIRLHLGIAEYLQAHGYAPVAGDPELMLTAWRAAD